MLLHFYWKIRYPLSTLVTKRHFVPYFLEQVTLVNAVLSDFMPTIHFSMQNY